MSGKSENVTTTKHLRGTVCRKKQLPKVSREVTRLRLTLANGANEHLSALVSRHVCKMGLEGIVSKRIGSRYRSAGEGSLHGY